MLRSKSRALRFYQMACMKYDWDESALPCKLLANLHQGGINPVRFKDAKNDL